MTLKTCECIELSKNGPCNGPCNGNQLEKILSYLGDRPLAKNGRVFRFG